MHKTSKLGAKANEHVVSPFPGHGHDHAACVRAAITQAEHLCAHRSRRLTPLRRRVLELVWESHQPVKAYDLLARLQQSSTSAAPPTVYRALDFLLGERLIHRLASLNAYVGCAQPTHQHTGEFLICAQCQAVAELDDAATSTLLAQRAEALGFALTTQTIELEGLCPRCRSDQADASSSVSS
ncbi:MAG: Fur family transcriptional regulator [Spiribacter sp.]|jgi:Fur family zinc uptake transcriptional regulator|nr:Fur family transcriptional regulator [Spiribacter sp.]MDR9488945.1 Fur family transcriptional regulator [Spiribacter sp.]